MTNEELLEKAKRDYPPGTVFTPAHVGEGQCKITEECTYKITGGYIYSLLPGGRNFEIDTPLEYGNTCYDRVLYDKNSNKWAEIVSKPKERIKSKLEVEKWYKWTWKINNLITYGKIQSISSDYFTVIEGIHNNRHTMSNGYCYRDCVNLEKLTDLSEIQKYLPDGHPDKIDYNEMKTEKSESLVGRYLKALIDTPDGGIIKAGEIGVVTFITSDNTPSIVDFPSQNGYHIRTSTFKNGKAYQLMPKDFNPDEKPTVIKENLVGRYVKALVSNPEAISMKIGEYCLITKENYTNADVTRFKDNSKGFGITLSNIGKIWELMPEGFTPEKEEEYKVGDYVITDRYSHDYDGRVLQITKITFNNCCYFKVFDGGYYNEEHNFDKESIQRRATQEEIDSIIKRNTIPQFKVGQWVTLTKSNKNWIQPMDAYVGRTVQITEILDSKIGRVDFDGAEHCWVYRDGHFRLATPSEIMHSMPESRVIIKDTKQLTSILTDIYSKPKKENEFGFVEPILLSTEKKKSKKLNLSIHI